MSWDIVKPRPSWQIAKNYGDKKLRFAPSANSYDTPGHLFGITVFAVFRIMAKRKNSSHRVQIVSRDEILQNKYVLKFISQRVRKAKPGIFSLSFICNVYAFGFLLNPFVVRAFFIRSFQTRLRIEEIHKCRLHNSTHPNYSQAWNYLAFVQILHNACTAWNRNIFSSLTRRFELKVF